MKITLIENLDVMEARLEAEEECVELERRLVEMRNGDILGHNMK